MNDDFYIGYLPTAPTPLRALLKRTVRALLIVVAVVALVSVKAQQPFAASAFEFDKARDFEGTVEARPYPTLLVTRPGTDSPSPYLLVAPGKHGADEFVRDYANQHVHLKGKLIYREEGTMIEVDPASIHAEGGAVIHGDAAEDLGPTTLTGEIVDSKCFLGVMNPGSGKVHRECAARCLSGGIPPAFLAEDAPGSQPSLYILTSTDGGPIPRRKLLQRVGERITINGRVIHIGSTVQLRVDPGEL
jgi:hypothetical protein